MPADITCHYHPPFYFVDYAAVRRQVQWLLNRLRVGDHSLSLLLVDDREMSQLNAHYRGKEGPTNVLSFSLQEGADDDPAPVYFKELGDIVISLDTARREAVELGHDLSLRIRWLIIHGLLHLLGWDHERSEHEALAMHEKEQELLRLYQHHRRHRMPHLAINVDHVATIRQARGTTEPDPVTAAAICELAGAAGIVAHLREDRRHMQDRDIRLLRQTIKTRLNLEMGATKEMIGIALDLQPDMVTLVPEKRQELTTEGGLDVLAQKKKIASAIDKFAKNTIPVSLFIDPDPAQIEISKELGATYVEIHTGRYADAENDGVREKEFELIAQSAEHAFQLGLKVNAGHGLDYRNTARVAALDTIEELSIGHAVISRSVYIGIEQAVREMLDIIRQGQSTLYVTK
ncbi:MAG: pyridoxine 5'-phosphate synthase [Desulfopila sp.]